MGAVQVARRESGREITWLVSAKPPECLQNRPGARTKTYKRVVDGSCAASGGAATTAAVRAMSAPTVRVAG